MKVGFYPKLAWEGIRKNKRLYLPYILTGCLMVMMYYILSYLTEAPSLEQMTGGSTLMVILTLGYFVITIFSALFLFYTNSFLIKQRYREFGLYNILGMDKKNICRIMLWETLYVAIAAIVLGIVAGIVFSKAAELILLNLLNMDVNYGLSVGAKSLRQTPVVYGIIYLLLLINSLIRVSREKPLELMQSSKVGERIPKRTWLYAAVGVAILLFAYYLAVSIEEPLTALLWFFIAVVLVILATFLLFIAGSVVFCKLLQKNKGYYYKPNHFVSVSSMVYRMKRNGAGLASICILLTMVLVMISSTTCLYFGSEDALRNKCPNGVNTLLTFYSIDEIGDENLDRMREVMRTYSGAEADLSGVRACEIPGLITRDGILIDYENAEGVTVASFDKVGYLSVISLDDYNKMYGTEETLGDDECFVYCERIDYDWKTFTMEYGDTYKVKGQLERFMVDGDTSAMLMPTVYLVVKDLVSFAAPVAELKNSFDEPMMVYDWRCGFDVATPEEEYAAVKGIRDAIKEFSDRHISFSIDSREESRAAFYDLYGSLFFLGIMLSIVFLLAAVLIIYYKQISEGYEDRARFEIMQKVGMTKHNIRKSINSQMLTVFFLPLVAAGVHLAFAFPFVTKIFRMFAFSNALLCVTVNLICFAVFGIFYALVYKITSGAYYTIVSGGRKD